MKCTVLFLVFLAVVPLFAKDNEDAQHDHLARFPFPCKLLGRLRRERAAFCCSKPDRNSTAVNVLCRRTKGPGHDDDDEDIGEKKGHPVCKLREKCREALKHIRNKIKEHVCDDKGSKKRGPFVRWLRCNVCKKCEKKGDKDDDEEEAVEDDDSGDRRPRIKFPCLLLRKMKQAKAALCCSRGKLPAAINKLREHVCKRRGHDDDDDDDAEKKKGHPVCKIRKICRKVLGRIHDKLKENIFCKGNHTRGGPFVRRLRCRLCGKCEKDGDEDGDEDDDADDDEDDDHDDDDDQDEPEDDGSGKPGKRRRFLKFPCMTLRRRLRMRAAFCCDHKPGPDAPAIATKVWSRLCRRPGCHGKDHDDEEDDDGKDRRPACFVRKMCWRGLMRMRLSNGLAKKALCSHPGGKKMHPFIRALRHKVCRKGGKGEDEDEDEDEGFDV